MYGKIGVWCGCRRRRSSSSSPVLTDCPPKWKWVMGVQILDENEQGVPAPPPAACYLPLSFLQRSNFEFGTKTTFTNT